MEDSVKSVKKSYCRGVEKNGGVLLNMDLSYRTPSNCNGKPYPGTYNNLIYHRLTVVLSLWKMCTRFVLSL